MIRLTDVRKVYRTRLGDNVVLDGVGFELRMGERLGVLGRNGAGKSTMVRLISGAERPTSGRVERSMSVSWPLAFGGAFQQTLTGLDNVRFISRVYDQDFTRNLAFVADFSELGPYLREPVRTYSSGMRARLAFAISMIIEFDCFLIDEIGAVGDARFHDRCNHELFGKRGDRAMVLISHDPGYLRDHCNRFSVLHGGRLEQFEDFDVAYDAFREQIGLGRPPPVDHAAAVDRSALVEVSQHRALADDRFRLLVREGDWSRNAQDWPAAEARYAAALALHPYQRSYWVQHAHMAKEDGRFGRAEASYRTACALGEPVTDVAEHLAFVMARQDLNAADWPLHAYRKDPGSMQAPGLPDLEALSRLLWDLPVPETADALDLLRCHATCDALAATLIRNPRFAGAPRRPTEEEGPRSPQRGSALPGTGGRGEVEPAVADAIRALALTHLPADESAALARRMSAGEAPWALVAEAGGMADWPLAQAALRQVFESSGQ